MPANLRASVTADALSLGPGDPVPILVDGSDTAILANGLDGYTPMAGDRILVTKVGGTLEVVQFLNVGSVPYAATFRQDTPPDVTTSPVGALWYDTSTTGGGKPNRLEAGSPPVWVPIPITSTAMDIPNVRNAAVERGFTMQGGGTATLGSGVAAPTTGPVPSFYWPQGSTFFFDPSFPNADQSNKFAGMVTYHADSTKWATAAMSLIGSGLTTIVILNKSNFALNSTLEIGTLKPWSSGFVAIGGVTAISHWYYLMGRDNNRSGDIYLYEIDGTTGNKTSEIRLGGPSAFNMDTFRATITNNTVDVQIVWVTTSGNLSLRHYTPPLGSGSFFPDGSDFVLKSGVGAQGVGGAFCGDAGSGLGTLTLWVALQQPSANTDIMAWSTVTPVNAVRQTGLDFPRASNKVYALGYDVASGHFVHIDSSAKFHTYSKLAVSGTQAVTCRQTNYDSDTNNYPAGTFIGGVDVSGTASTAHETGYSPISNLTLPRRSWLRIAVQTPQDYTDVDATHVDKANRAGVYVALGGGTMWRQAYTPALGSLLVDNFDTMPSSGTPDVHDFSTAAAALGKLQSAAVRLDGLPRTYLDGSGAGRADGIILPGFMTMSAIPGVNTPAGWLKCDGAAVSRATFPDLMAALVFTFTGTSVNTSINMTIPAGLASGAITQGADITGPGLTSQTVASVSGTTLTLSAAAGAGAGPGTFTVWPWGKGDGSTTFNIPDMTGRFPLGANPGAVAATRLEGVGGNETGTGVNGTTQALRESRLNHAHTHDAAIVGAANALGTGALQRVATVQGVNNGTATTTSSGVGGGNLANHALLTLNFLIKT